MKIHIISFNLLGFPVLGLVYIFRYFIPKVKIFKNMMNKWLHIYIYMYIPQIIYAEV